MKIAFTICSNNYLAQAKTLGDSIKRYNPEYYFFIGLADKLTDRIDYEREIDHSIVLASEIGIPDFDSLWKKYNIIELNTCIKPFFFQYFVAKCPDLEYIFYLDPDTCVFNNFSYIEIEFGSDSNILITPHILSPIGLDCKMPDEQLFLNHGIYNLGFLGLKRPNLLSDLIEWWKERTYHLGFNNTQNGLFVDQLWFNLVPIFFNKVRISKHRVLNMAPWNLHERNLSKVNEEYIVNKEDNLVFYHFSNFEYSAPEILAKDYDRYGFKQRPDLQGIYQYYHKQLINNEVGKFSKITCEYMELRVKNMKEEELKRASSSLKYLIKYCLKKMAPPKMIRILKAINN
jgi:hypothetical protein